MLFLLNVDFIPLFHMYSQMNSPLNSHSASRVYSVDYYSVFTLESVADQNGIDSCMELFLTNFSCTCVVMPIAGTSVLYFTTNFM